MAQFHHEHILPLIGVCLDPHPDGPYMLLEFMDKGDLSNYLKAVRNASPVREEAVIGPDLTVAGVRLMGILLMITMKPT